MDPSVLRSRLCYAIEELQFLTTQELVDCKWTTVQRVFTALFEKSASLREYSERVSNLMEIRNVELQLRRTSTENREEWKDRNSNFKTSFMRIIIDGLSFLRWPPSQVAFSDPLEMLLSDPKDAIAFILDFGIPKETNRHNRVKRNDSSSNALSTPMKDRNDSCRQTNLQISPRASPKSGTTLQNTSQGARNPMNFDEFYADDSVFVENQRPGSVQNHGLGSVLQTEAFYPPHDEQNQSRRDDRTMPVNTERESPATPASFRKFTQSFEILQHQNEVLSRQLKRLQDSVLARDRLEISLGAILSDFRSSVDEIVNISKGDSRMGENSQTYRIPDLSKNILLTKTLDEDFQEEVRREKELEKRETENLNNLSGLGKSVYSTKKKESLSFSSDRTSGFEGQRPLPPPIGGSAIMFCKLQEKLRKLDKEWVEAKKRVTSCFLDTVEPHHKCDIYLSGQETDIERGSEGGRGRDKGSKQKGPANSTFDSFNTFNNDRGWDGNTHNTHNSQSSTENNHSNRPRSGKAARPESPKVRKSLSCRIRTHEILGVKPPLSLGTLDLDGGSQTNTHNGLNLQRVHVLQKDLVQFSEAAFLFFSEYSQKSGNTQNAQNAPNKISKNENNDLRKGRRKYENENEIQGFYPDPFPTSQIDSERQLSLFSLYERSQGLLLHLSCLAPLSPLIADPPYSSSLTGLELLEKEIAIIYPHQPSGSGPKAQAAVRLQGVVDRIKTEQINLIRCLQCSNAMLHQWSTAGHNIVPLFSTFSKNSTEHSLKSHQEIAELCSSLNRIIDCVAVAEGARILGQEIPVPPALKGKSRSLSIGLGKGTGAGPGSGAGSGSGLGLGTPLSARSGMSSGSGSGSGAGSGLSSGSGIGFGSISPFDSLSRGCMGEEMATLVNTLRMYMEDVKLIPRAFETLRGAAINGNMSGLRAFEEAKKKILFAANSTESTVHTIETSWQFTRNE